MKKLNETQMQALRGAAEDDGAPLEGHHPRTIASLIKQGQVTKRRNRGGKYLLVATPAGKALLHEQLADSPQAAETRSICDVPAASARSSGTKDKSRRTV